MIRLGVGSYTFAWSVGVPSFLPASPMDVFTLLKRAVELEVTVVQIADNPPLHQLDPARLTKLGEEAQHNGITLEVGTRGITPAGLQRYLDIAQQLDSPIDLPLLAGPASMLVHVNTRSSR